MATKYNYYPDKIKRMLLEDPYRPLHNWNMLKHLKTLKEVTGIEPKKGRLSILEIKQLEENMELYQSLNPDVEILKELIKQRLSYLIRLVFGILYPITYVGDY